MEDDPLVFSDKKEVLRKLPLWKKLSYAIGSLAYSMCITVMGFYLIVFLLEVALLNTNYVLIIVFLGRVWDGITDPMVGYLCGRTKTKLGQFRPWLVISAVPLAIAYTLLWFVPDTTNKPLDFLYYISMYFLVQALLTCVHVPYTALNVHLSYDQKETDSVTMYRLMFEVLGTIFGILIYTVSYAGFVRKEDVCIDGVRESSTEKQRAYRYQAVTISVLAVLCILIPFFTVKEQKDEVNKKHKLSFIGGIKETFGFKPYRELILMTLFSWLGLQFSQGNYVLYLKYSLGFTDQYPYVIGALLVCTVLWMPVWQILMPKLGKKEVFRIAMLMMMPGLIVLLFIDYFPYLIYPLALWSGAGVSGIYLVPWSMLPDVVDAAYLEKGARREELFYAFFVFGIKCSSGLSLAISTGTYNLGGYDQLSCDQPWSVPLMFKVLIAGPAVICILISLLFLHRYPITDAMRKETARKLKERRKNDREDKSHAPAAVIISHDDHDDYNEGPPSTLKGELQHSNTAM